MKELVQSFTDQLREAKEIASKAIISEASDISNILITGLGGSGIGGTILYEVISNRCPVPVIINKDYFLPAFVNADTLVIVCSYSGNTEETLAAMKQAIKAKAKIVCITSGGEIEKLAAKKGYDCIILPGGMPPRACIGYSLVQVLFVLKHYGLLRTKFTAEINAAIELIVKDRKAIEKKAQGIAQKLAGRTPIIYAAQDFEGLAIRVRQQINENSKMLAWHGAIPDVPVSKDCR